MKNGCCRRLHSTRWFPNQEFQVGLASRSQESRLDLLPRTPRWTSQSQKSRPDNLQQKGIVLHLLNQSRQSRLVTAARNLYSWASKSNVSCCYLGNDRRSRIAPVFTLLLRMFLDSPLVPGQSRNAGPPIAPVPLPNALSKSSAKLITHLSLHLRPRYRHPSCILCPLPPTQSQPDARS